MRYHVGGIVGEKLEKRVGVSGKLEHGRYPGFCPLRNKGNLNLKIRNLKMFEYVVFSLFIGLFFFKFKEH